MKLIKRILKDEKSAPNDYKKLLSQLNNNSDKKIVKNIIKDERRHFKIIKSLERKK